jgi:hypothetical protein
LCPGYAGETREATHKTIGLSQVLVDGQALSEQRSCARPITRREDGMPEVMKFRFGVRLIA